MKNKLDKLKNIIKYDKKLIIFMIVLVLIGIIIGTLFVIILNKSDKQIITKYLEQFLRNIKSNKFLYKNTINNALIINMVYILIIWLLGMSVIGVPITILIMFYKSFVLGFSISSFIITYGLKGCVLSFVYVFPHLIISLMFYIILCTYSIRLSLKLFSSIMGKKTINFKNIVNKYFNVLIICSIIIILTVLYEVFVMPMLIKFIVSILF